MIRALNALRPHCSTNRSFGRLLWGKAHHRAPNTHPVPGGKSRRVGGDASGRSQFTAPSADRGRSGRNDPAFAGGLDSGCA